MHYATEAQLSENMNAKQATMCTGLAQNDPNKPFITGMFKLAAFTAPCHQNTLCKKATIHQLTTMLATSKMSYFQVITTC